MTDTPATTRPSRRSALRHLLSAPIAAAAVTNTSAFPTVVESRIGNALVQTVNARNLHAALKVGKDFSTWIKGRIMAYGFTEHTDYEVLTEFGERPQPIENTPLPKMGERDWGGENKKEYALTLDMAKELAMVERNEKGREIRRYFIACERKLMEAELRVKSKPVRVKAHRRALPQPGAEIDESAIPGKFEPGSNIVCDLHSVVKSAAYRMKDGQAADIFSALLGVLDDIGRRRDDPAAPIGGHLFDWDYRRANRAFAERRKAEGRNHHLRIAKSA